jgi:hypothetical protein
MIDFLSNFIYFFNYFIFFSLLTYIFMTKIYVFFKKENNIFIESNQKKIYEKDLIKNEYKNKVIELEIQKEIFNSYNFDLEKWKTDYLKEIEEKQKAEEEFINSFNNLKNISLENKKKCLFKKILKEELIKNLESFIYESRKKNIDLEKIAFKIAINKINKKNNKKKVLE